MTILVSESIEHKGLITPFLDEKHTFNHPGYGPVFKEGSDPFTLSYGASYAGYDIRMSLHENIGESEWGLEAVRLMPQQFRLVHSIEHFNMTDDVLGKVADKSTLARKGLAVQNTIIEPGWKGYLTLEITNHGDEVIELYHDMPIAQIIFFNLEKSVDGYKGKYQNQENRPVGAR